MACLNSNADSRGSPYPLLECMLLLADPPPVFQSSDSSPLGSSSRGSSSGHGKSHFRICSGGKAASGGKILLIGICGDWAKADTKSADGDEGDFVVDLCLRSIVVKVQSEGLAWGWDDVGV